MGSRRVLSVVSKEYRGGAETLGDVWNTLLPEDPLEWTTYTNLYIIG